MSAKNSLCWIVCAVTLSIATFGFAPDAKSLSFERFESLPDHQKANFVSTVLHHFYYNYRGDPQLAYKADCMMDLDGDNVRDEDERLYAFVMQDLRSARASASQGASVEGVIKFIIDRTCTGR